MNLLVLGLAASLVSPFAFAQSSGSDPLRQAYPICFEAFPDEASTEHSVCIELSARNASTNWTRPSLETAVRNHLAKQKEATAAEETLKAQRGDANALEFKGITLGQDLATIKATGRFTCHNPQLAIADTACTLHNQRETVAGAPVKLLSLLFYADKLHSISVVYDATDFTAVASALTDKYGQPVVKTETIQNRMGASFENRTLTWAKAGGSVEARRYTSQLDRSDIRWISNAYLKEYAARRKSITKNSAKDL